MSALEIEGVEGPPGPAGPQGPPGEASTFEFTQTQPSASWTIVHNLNRFPSVSVVDSGGSAIEPDVLYENANAITLGFGSPTSGKAYLN